MRLRVLFVVLLLTAGCARERFRPNVLLITLDTTRADRLGCYGGPAGITPAIDALAREGVRFAQADSPVPLTLPAHATLLTGLLPLHHGLRVNGAGSLPAGQETLATRFADAGYRTAAVVGSFVLDSRFGLDRGFASYDDAMDLDADGAAGEQPQRRASAVVDAALRWLEGPDERPFFLWVHLFDPHAPYEPPQSHRRFGAYEGEIAYMDAQIGRLTARIDRKKTIVAIVGDHGESLGEHGEQQHGLLLYESTLRVPFIIAAPDVAPRVVNQPVGTVDLAPTIAALAGLTLKGDGRDLALRSGAEPPRADLYAETQYPLMFGWSELASLRRENLKLVEGLSAELLDIAAGERANVAEQNRRLFRELSERLRTIRATAISPIAAAVDAETKAKLESLGYVAPSGSALAPRGDPRAMVRVFSDWERANDALAGDRIDDAVRIGETLVAADPANRIFRSTLARALRSRGDMARAIQLYRQAVALAPSDAGAWYDLASALQENGMLAEAGTVVEEAIRRDSERSEGYNIRGSVRAERGDLAGALQDFEKAIELDPRNARAWANRGNALRSMNRVEDAVEAYRHSIELAPRYADARNGLGAALVQQGKAIEAIAHFDAALAVAPDFYEARLNRAIAYEVAGDRPRAADEVDRLLRDMPNSSDFSEVRAAAKQFRGTLRR